MMVAIGRGLMRKPKLLLLDEPSWGIAPILVDKIFEVIHEIRKEMGLFKDLRIVKVEGHAGILENERADRLARDAIES